MLRSGGVLVEGFSSCRAVARENSDHQVVNLRVLLVRCDVRSETKVETHGPVLQWVSGSSTQVLGLESLSPRV